MVQLRFCLPALKAKPATSMENILMSESLLIGKQLKELSTFLNQLVGFKEGVFDS